MFIRRTTIKSRQHGEPYYTYRLVESVRTPNGVRQRTLLNLGRHFEVPRPQWTALALHIEQRINAQSELFDSELDSQWHDLAERLAAQLLHAQSKFADDSSETANIQSVDLNSLDLLRPRTVGVEHLCLHAARQIGLDAKLQALGFNRRQCQAALGNIIARMVMPGSERASHQWLCERSALGELLEFDFNKLSPMALYRASDQLYANQQALEQFLYERERTLFEFDELITLYDLTNTYFEGQASANPDAQRGKSKEKRSDCPLVTLALVLDGSGFPRRSAILPGNASEPKTLESMLKQLAPGGDGATTSGRRPTVVLDAGLATEENLSWLRDNQWHYLVVSRKRQRQFEPEQAVTVKHQGQCKVAVHRCVNEDTGEVELYCHSTMREEKERAMDRKASTALETELKTLSQGLSRKSTVKRYDKVLERVGRLRQKYSRVARHYDITVEPEPDGKRAKAVRWKRVVASDHTLPGVYCLRSDRQDWDDTTLWHTYTMLTDLEAVFRTLKSELGLRPVFHHKQRRVAGHLFISVLAYHLVHSIRLQLKSADIDLSWDSIRRALSTQTRVTAELKRADGTSVHIRRSTRAEPHQLQLYDALGLNPRPGRTEITDNEIRNSATM